MLGFFRLVRIGFVLRNARTMMGKRIDSLRTIDDRPYEGNEFCARR